MLLNQRAFDTRIDTMKIFVPMTIKFKLRNYINSENLSPIFLDVCSSNKRKRINLDLHVNPRLWNPKSQRLKTNEDDMKDVNLILDNISSRITKIKTSFRLSGRILTFETFLDEFENEMPRSNFLKFFELILKDRRATIRKGTYDKEMAILKKLKAYRNIIAFHEIDIMFFQKYRNHLARLGNGPVTRNGNVKIIKKYLRFAEKAGVTLSISLDDIKGGPTAGKKNYLNPQEVKACYDYYFSNFIPYNQKIALGYFLFSCFTGLRISDLFQQKRNFLLTGSFTFTHVKTKRNQVIKLNSKSRGILEHCEDLFIKKYSKTHTRELVKSICGFLQINKKVDFHMSRHTFGTNFILLGGDVVRLKELMNHSDIRETMTYVHLAELEKNAEADIMDGLFEKR